ncbi:MAG TPA: hypothetical protein VGO86_08355 [Candidatus Dormibacteraeota bacterium]|jgi:hypothetical protein
MAVVHAGSEARWPRPSEIDWLTAAEVVREGFRRSRVVMMNEAVNGLQRCVRTRRTGTSILPVAWASGARLLAVESLGPPGGEPPNAEVLRQPEMAELLATARRLGFRLSGYDADRATIPIKWRTKTKSPAFGNWRNARQATNLATLYSELPAQARMLVWAPNRHHAKVRFMQYRPTGWQFQTTSNVDPFVIDQTATVSYVDRRYGSPILDWAAGELRRRHGEAGFIWREGMPRLSPGCDAWILSLDNRLE